jgi:hypothetical protein
LPKTLCKVLSPSQNLLCVQTEIKKSKKRVIQTIMVSTRSSDYVAIGGGGDGIGGKSRLSKLLARGLPLKGEEEKDNDSTPVVFDVNDGNGGKVIEVNGECKGDGNIDGLVDNTLMTTTTWAMTLRMTTMGGGGPNKSANVGRVWRSGRRWR